ncbi:MAG: preprotein translocase subunit SecE [Syntrophomonadaceae bacterium]|nr:preprotein translocase subunit SecE [Syntrophomonadaceae bacterium]MDD3889277.1 preprotein translocase subunit SecE [Syntrophomonadaceae bacterium]MDD4549326.1 preprotein translocase subunit SecE [Syntrophomonadaceae bacterium]
MSFKDRWENIKQYFRSVYNELKKVHWPGKRQIIAYTGVVLIAVALVATIIWVFDMGLSVLLELIFNAFA